MMKNNYAVPRESNAKKAKSTFDNEEQLRGRSGRYEMRNNYKFQIITTAMKAQSILDDKEQLCGADGMKCQEGAFYPSW